MGGQGTVLQDQMYLANLSSSDGPEKKIDKNPGSSARDFPSFFFPRSLVEGGSLIRRNKEEFGEAQSKASDFGGKDE